MKTIRELFAKAAKTTKKIRYTRKDGKTVEYEREVNAKEKAKAREAASKNGKKSRQAKKETVKLKLRNNPMSAQLLAGNKSALIEKALANAKTPAEAKALINKAFDDFESDLLATTLAQMDVKRQAKTPAKTPAKKPKAAPKPKPKEGFGKENKSSFGSKRNKGFKRNTKDASFEGVQERQEAQQAIDAKISEIATLALSGEFSMSEIATGISEVASTPEQAKRMVQGITDNMRKQVMNEVDEKTGEKVTQQPLPLGITRETANNTIATVDNMMTSAEKALAGQLSDDDKGAIVAQLIDVRALLYELDGMTPNNVLGAVQSSNIDERFKQVAEGLLENTENMEVFLAVADHIVDTLVTSFAEPQSDPELIAATIKDMRDLARDYDVEGILPNVNAETGELEYEVTEDENNNMQDAYNEVLADIDMTTEVDTNVHEYMDVTGAHGRDASTLALLLKRWNGAGPVFKRDSQGRRQIHPRIRSVVVEHPLVQQFLDAGKLESGLARGDVTKITYDKNDLDKPNQQKETAQQKALKDMETLLDKLTQNKNKQTEQQARADSDTIQEVEQALDNPREATTESPTSEISSRISNLIESAKDASRKRILQDNIELLERAESLPIDIDIEDVPFQSTEAAYRNLMFSTERHATIKQLSYLENIVGFYNRLNSVAETDEQKTLIPEMLRTYKEKYLKRFLDVINKDARTSSAMITGPSGRNNEREQKRHDIAHRAQGELMEWSEYMEDKLVGKVLKARPDYGQRENETISSDDPKAIEKLQAKIKKAKAGEIDLTSQTVRNMEKRLVSLKRNKAQADKIKAEKERGNEDAGVVHYENIGMTAIQNTEANRLQIKFNERLSKEDYKFMRSSGFVWSRRNQAFQRKLNTRANFFTKKIAKHFGSDEPTPKQQKS